MDLLYIALGVIGALLVAFIFVVAIRAIAFKPKKQPPCVESDTDFDA